MFGSDGAGDDASKIGGMCGMFVLCSCRRPPGLLGRFSWGSAAASRSLSSVSRAAVRKLRFPSAVASMLARGGTQRTEVKWALRGDPTVTEVRAVM